MNEYEKDYLQLVREVQYGGIQRTSRAGPTIGKFGMFFKTDALRHGQFPVLTTRKMFIAPVFGELAAFVRGSKDVADFKTWGCNYWDMNAAQWGMNAHIDPASHSVGRIYGVQWREWNYFYDQLDKLVTSIEQDPYGRRHIVTAWNPSELNEMCLPPCHIMMQAYVNADGYLDLLVSMRSVDLCLGFPSDVVLYAAFLIALAKQVGLKPGTLSWSLGDSHIYENHLALFVEQQRREPYELPTFTYDGGDLIRFIPADLRIHDYKSHEAIRYALN